MNRNELQELLEKASNNLVSGVSAGGRLFKAVGLPLWLEKAGGPWLYSLDGRRFLDFHTSSGAALLGHNHPAIAKALKESIKMGFFCNHDTIYHHELAEKLCRIIPCAEKVRFANSGSEATMAAIRLSRAVTGRKKIIKFEGHFHGMHELTYYNCHTPITPLSKTGEIDAVADSAGIPTEFASEIIVIPFNEPEILSSCIKRYKNEIAAVILEPVMYNAGCILAKKDFLQYIRKETEKAGIILIFDEVLTGFRMALGGAQEYYGVIPDLCTLAKALGGSGIPIAALAGRDWVMNGLNPKGNTVVSGTYSGHLMEIMCSLAAVETMSVEGFYDTLNSNADYFYNEINNLINKYSIKAVVQGVGARFAIYFGLTEAPIYDYRKAAKEYDFDGNNKFLVKAWEKDLYFHDFANKLTPTHHGISSSHSRKNLDLALGKIEDIFKKF